MNAAHIALQAKLTCVYLALAGCASGGRSHAGRPNGGAPDLDHGFAGATPNGAGAQSCAGGASTTVSGTVYDPAGKNPLYDVAVYVPGATPAALPQGATCGTCNSLYTGDPIAATLTDAAGHFTLTGVPTGANVPLVVQVGKWRRQMLVPNVHACEDNPLTDKSIRLPRNHDEGDMPNIAVSTGLADSLECLLHRVGVDASEYVPGASDAGRVHIFTGSPDDSLGTLGALAGAVPNTSTPGPKSSDALWDTKDDLMHYDVVLLSCEGEETQGMNQQAMFDYLAAGGRVFASHFHYAWFDSGPFASADLAAWTPGDITFGTLQGSLVTTLASGAPFPKGVALAKWLGTTSALSPDGTLAILDSRDDANVGAANTHSQAWITSAIMGDSTQYFSFNTPFDVSDDKQCGRGVFSDLHVGAASDDYATSIDGTKVVPDGCGDGDLSPQEKALEFMLFDLSSCVTPDDKPPAPPMITVK